MGVTMPCLFYVPDNERLYYLYPLQFQTDQNFTVTTASNQVLKITLNFCRYLTALAPNLTYQQGQPLAGAPFFINQATGDTYGLAYFNSPINTTLWKIQPIDGRGPGGGVQIVADNSRSMSDIPLFNITYQFLCDENVPPSKANTTLKLTSFYSSNLTITVTSSAACGYVPPAWIGSFVNSEITVGILCLLLSMCFIIAGFRFFKIGLGIFSFLLGVVTTVILIFSASNPEWDAASATIYIIFILIMSYSLAKTAYTYPNGVIYTLAAALGALIGYGLANAWQLQTRMVAGYYLLWVGLPVLLIYFSHKYMLQVKIGFTSFIGTILFINFLNELDFMNFFWALCSFSLLYVGWKIQMRIFNKYGGGDAVQTDLEELMDEQ